MTRESLSVLLTEIKGSICNNSIRKFQTKRFFYPLCINCTNEFGVSTTPTQQLFPLLSSSTTSSTVLLQHNYVLPTRSYSTTTSSTCDRWTCTNCQHENRVADRRADAPVGVTGESSQDAASPAIRFFCQGCGTIRSPESFAFDATNILDLFRLFRLHPIKFDISSEQLDMEYRQLQRQLHPDKFSTESEDVRNHASHFSSIASVAYSDLKNPLSRGRLLFSHLLLQSPVSPVGNNEASSQVRNHHAVNVEDGDHGNNDRIEDPALLLQILELEEQIVELKNSEEARKMHAEILSQQQQCLDDLTEAFRAQNLQQAKHLLQQAQLVHRVIQKLNYWNLGEDGSH